MCLKTPKINKPQVEVPDDASATAAATAEAKLRRRRAGAAADILTSSSGIPVSPTMGGIAQ